MCSHFKSSGNVWKQGAELKLSLSRGQIVGTWVGFAQEERQKWWMQAGRGLGQFPVEEIAQQSTETGEMVWGEVPVGSNLLFLLGPEIKGKTRNYTPLRLVTRRATKAELAKFGHDRFPLLGKLMPDGSFANI